MLGNAAIAKTGGAKVPMVYISSMVLEEIKHRVQQLSDAAEKRLWKLTKASIMSGGTKAPEEVVKARERACETSQGGKPCQYNGMVEPIREGGAVKLPGCTQCGCPFETKRQLLTLGTVKVKCPLGLWDFENQNL